MTETTRLKLPLLAAAQAQKHVTINEALTLLDLLTGIIPVLSRTYAAPPEGNSDGDVYILAGSGTGDWSGYDANDVVMMIDGGWRRALPSTGMVATIADEANYYVAWDGTAWSAVANAPNPSATLAPNLRNKIINGGGRINQRGATSIGDDTYGHDRHYALVQTGAIAVSTLTAPADGIAAMMRLTQSQATAQRMGYAQIVEAANTYGPARQDDDARRQAALLGRPGDPLCRSRMDRHRRCRHLRCRQRLGQRQLRRRRLLHRLRADRAPGRRDHASRRHHHRLVDHGGHRLGGQQPHCRLLDRGDRRPERDARHALVSGRGRCDG